MPSPPRAGAHASLPPSVGVGHSTQLTGAAPASPAKGNTEPSNNVSVSAATRAVAPSLVRRSSYEPLRLGSLPTPQFTRAPPGQRSVPAIEFISGNSVKPNKANINDVALTSIVPSSSGLAASNSTSTTAAAVAAAAAVASGGATVTSGSSAATTPLALGNGVLNAEPWNLWTDASAPAAPSSSSSATSPRRVLSVRSDDDADHTDAELASALAAAVVLDREDKVIKSPLTGSPTQTKSPAQHGLVSARTWPKEFAASSSLPPQSFALDPAASPTSQLKPVKSASGSDLSVGAKHLQFGRHPPRRKS